MGQSVKRVSPTWAKAATNGLLTFSAEAAPLDKNHFFLTLSKKNTSNIFFKNISNILEFSREPFRHLGAVLSENLSNVLAEVTASRAIP